MRSHFAEGFFRSRPERKTACCAKMQGIHTVLVPKENLADVEELSVEITKGLEIIPVESMNEVLKTALVR